MEVIIISSFSNVTFESKFCSKLQKLGMWLFLQILFTSCTGTSGSSGSAGTAIRLNSQDSTASVDDAGSPWNATRQTSISLREWDIPYEELKIADKIGSGRFSTGKL